MKCAHIKTVKGTLGCYTSKRRAEPLTRSRAFNLLNALIQLIYNADL